jgi:hypothetical protein
LLVVANQTAASNELRSFLLGRTVSGPIAVTLLLSAGRCGPDPPGHAETRLAEALDGLRAAGIEATGMVGDDDPFVAACEVYRPALYDEIVISTLPLGASMWLANNTPQRVQHATGALVTHVMPDAKPMMFA